MTRIKFKLRSVATVFACLAVTIFASCGNGDDQGNDPTPNDGGEMVIRDRTGEAAEGETVVKGFPDAATFLGCGFSNFMVEPNTGAEHGYTFHYIATPENIEHGNYDPDRGYAWYSGNGGITVYVDINYKTDFREIYPGSSVVSGIDHAKADDYFWSGDTYESMIESFLSQFRDNPIAGADEDIVYSFNITPANEGYESFPTYTGEGVYIDKNGIEGKIFITITPATATATNLGTQYADVGVISDLWTDMPAYWATGLKMTITWSVSKVA
jgi:hypothetical protein